MSFVSTRLQLFRQRLSHESVKAYATMPIGIMGSESLALLDWVSTRFSNKGRERTNTCLCCFLSPRWSTLRFTQASVKTTITHNNFRHCRVSFSPFVRQPFSKQLYTRVSCLGLLMFQSWYLFFSALVEVVPIDFHRVETTSVGTSRYDPIESWRVVKILYPPTSRSFTSGKQNIRFPLRLDFR